MFRLYDFFESGNGYKVRLLLNHLGAEYERVELDILAGATRTPEYLRINPNGRIPVLVLEDGSALAESNAILFYLAEGSDFLPNEHRSRARILQWMFFEQYSHEPYLAVLRFWAFSGASEQNAAAIPEKRRRGEEALAVMEHHLKQQTFFVDERYSIADIALYAYTHVAGEGGFDLSRYPAVRSWIDRVADQPGHIPISQL